VASKFAVPLSASYAASKSAVHTYFTTLAAEHPDLKICLPCPGPVATPLFDAILDDKDESNTKKKKKKKQSKMEAKRCARLMISTMIMGSDTGSHETWIAQQPTLFFLYLHQHLPGLANWLLQRVLGPTRVALWEAGLDIYDPASLGELRKLRKAEAAANKEE
jgi:dehydrogenase/reductase SDR family protein 7